MRALSLAAAMLLAGCACVPPAEEAGSALASEDCPAVRRADTWVNRMPGPERASRTLIVLLELETAERWTMRRADTSSVGGRIRLDLIQGGHGHPGSASWRLAGGDTPRVIEIFCAGAPHYSIAKITSAH